MTFRGRNAPLLNARFYGWRRGMLRREHQFIPSRRGECVMRGAGGIAPFFLVASRQRCFVVMATTRKYFVRQPDLAPFW